MTTLERLLAGEGPPVLQTCRFEGLGGQLYGRDAVGDALKTVAFGPATLDVETRRLAVWLDRDTALVADLAEGGVQRLWLLTEAVTLSPQPAVDVPVDPDLAQARRVARFDPEDHPDLDTADADRVISAVTGWTDTGLISPRPVVLRAASFGSIAIALVRLEGERDAAALQPIGFSALVVAKADTVTRRLDLAGRTAAFARVWTPRL